MAREKELFRDNLKRLDERYPEKEIFTWAQAAKIAGLNVRTMKKYYQRKDEPAVSKVRLASILS